MDAHLTESEPDKQNAVRRLSLRKNRKATRARVDVVRITCHAPAPVGATLNEWSTRLSISKDALMANILAHALSKRPTLEDLLAYAHSSIEKIQLPLLSKRGNACTTK